jgi:hypothetical protein
MSWKADSQVTNTDLLRNAALGAYVGGNLGIYRCPADNYISPLQSLAGYPARARSMSMNQFVGPYDPTWAGGRNTFWPAYRQFLKLTEIPNPANVFVTVDEHPDSINDGYIQILYNVGVTLLENATRWNDLPASYHCGACGFSFADGHSEMHKWKASKATLIPINTSTTGFPVYDTSQDANLYMDLQWVAQRCSVLAN